jgi:hypothetical protein
MPRGAENSKSKGKFLKFFEGLKKKRRTPKKIVQTDVVSKVKPSLTEPVRRESPTQSSARLKPLSIPDPPSACSAPTASTPSTPPPTSYKKKVITYGVKYWRWSIPLLSKYYIITL